MIECRTTVTGAVGQLLARNNLTPRDIDVLITTCSVFCPTPSMASMVVNAFGLPKNIQAYHLGGMGCGNGVVVMGLVKDLLKARPGARILLVTTEVTTPAYYVGRDYHRQVTNMLFRMGAAAALFATTPTIVPRASKGFGGALASVLPRPLAALALPLITPILGGPRPLRAKYRLKHHVRVHMGGREAAYRCIWYGPDDEGLNGVYLGKDVVAEASGGLKHALTEIGPRVLSWSQIASFAANAAARALLGSKRYKAYKPSFGRGRSTLDHILIHAGGAKVLDGIGRELQLSEHDLEPSRAVLRDYGNVSSSSTWYTLAYVETARGVAKGDTIMQVGVGSGVKCGVCVWRAARDVRDVHCAWSHTVGLPLGTDGGEKAGRRLGAGEGVLVRRAARDAVRAALLALVLCVVVLGALALLPPGTVQRHPLVPEPARQAAAALEPAVAPLAQLLAPAARAAAPAAAFAREAAAPLVAGAAESARVLADGVGRLVGLEEAPSEVVARFLKGGAGSGSSGRWLGGVINGAHH
jgi:3-ketoacyl-CoA synthase